MSTDRDSKSILETERSVLPEEGYLYRHPFIRELERAEKRKRRSIFAEKAFPYAIAFTTGTILSYIIYKTLY